MREPLFKKGDIVTIRSYEDMNQAYGDPSLIPYGFYHHMDHLCGRSFTVQDVTWDSEYETYEIDIRTGLPYSFSEEMFERPDISFIDDISFSCQILDLFKETAS